MFALTFRTDTNNFVNTIFIKNFKKYTKLKTIKQQINHINIFRDFLNMNNRKTLKIRLLLIEQIWKFKYIKNLL